MSLQLRGLFVILCFLASYSCFAKPGLNDYGELPAISQLIVSPSGELFSFRRTGNGKDALLVYSRKNQEIIYALDVSTIDPHGQYFIDDNYLVLIGSKFMKIPGYIGEHNVRNAYLVDIKDKSIRAPAKLGQIINGEQRIYMGQLGIGSVIGFDKAQETLLMPMLVAESETDHSPNFSLLSVKLKKPNKIKLVHKGKPSTIDYFTNQQGELLAREDFNDEKNIHTILARHGNEWIPIYEREVEIREISVVGLSADFKSLVVISTKAGENFNTYYEMSLVDGARKLLDIGRSDADIDYVLQDINRVAYGVVYSGLSPSYRFFDPAMNTRMQAIIEQFPGHSVTISSYSPNFKHLIVKVEGSQAAGDFYFFSENNEAQYLMGAYPNIPVEEINPIATLKYKARDGRSIPTILTIPKDKLSSIKNLPTVIFPHGGPQANDSIRFDYFTQALASEGYLVVQPQFRGSSGFGLEHQEAGYGEWGKKMQDDLSDAVNFLESKGYTDKSRVCIAGASYGGYAALAGAAFTPDLYKCAVSIAGVSDIPALLKEDRSTYGKQSELMSYMKNRVGAGVLDYKALAAVSPVNFAEQIQIPVLLIHGEDDKRVEYSQSKKMYNALNKAKKKVELIKLKNEGHNLSDGETRLQALEALVKFVNANIGQ